VRFICSKAKDSPLSSTAHNVVGSQATVFPLIVKVSFYRNEFAIHVHNFPESFNPLNTELNPIRHLLAQAGAHHFVHVSRIKVNEEKFTFSPLDKYGGLVSHTKKKVFQLIRR
jgi:hypothetical protein